MYSTDRVNYYDRSTCSYTEEQIVEVLKILSPQPITEGKVRIGGNGGDGGYVVVDNLAAGGIVYSFGVGHTCQFERDMGRRGYTSYMYDHTVNRNNVNLDQTMNFFPYGVSDSPSPNMKTIPQIIEDHSHQDRKNIILQCDIEGGEWQIFKTVTQEHLSVFSQIVIELHSLDKCIMNMSNMKRGRLEHWSFHEMKQTLQTIGEQFVAVHVHGNNIRGTFPIQGQIVPEVLEVTFARKDLITPTSIKENYPTPLDVPNSRNSPDISLGTFSWE